MIEKVLKLYLVGVIGWLGWNIAKNTKPADLLPAKQSGLHIVKAPRPQAVVAGQPLLMYVEAHSSRSDELHYQWYFNKIPIPGAEGPTLTLFNFQKGNEGYYSVVIRGARESIQSPLVLVGIDQNVTSPSPRSAASTWQQAGPFDTVPGR